MHLAPGTRQHLHLEEMQGRDSLPFTSTMPVSVASSSRDQWAWLDAAGRSLNCGFLLVDAEGSAGPVIGSAHVAEPLRLLAAREDSPLVETIRRALESDDVYSDTVGVLKILCRRLTVQDKTAGALIVAMTTFGPAEDLSGPPKGGRHVPEAIEPWLIAAIEAHLGQKPQDDSEEAFDRISSLHRLLHESVEGGNEREVLTAFAEAVFAWDGVEAIGYVEDVQSQWRRAMAPPAATLPVMLEANFGQRLREKRIDRLTPDELSHLGFSSGRQVVVSPLGDTIPEPWVLLFAEGYRPLNLPRLHLYADLLREALARLSGIVETRAAWAILQTLLGAGERIEPAVDGALRDFSRVVDGLAVSLIVTSATGTTLLASGDRESIAAVRPYDRGNRLVSTAHLPDLGTMQLAVRRARGQSFTRREQHLVDRAAAIISAWLPGALRQPVEKAAATTATRSFEEVLDRAAMQITRDGLDVSVVVIVVPDSESRIAVIQSWVTEIRARLRGSDLAGAISDREIGVLLYGTSQTDVPIVCDRLGRSLGFEKAGVPTPMGSASRSAGSADDESIVTLARHNVNGRAKKRRNGAQA
jgi:hypothetical protein